LQAHEALREMLTHWTDGRIKMYLTSVGLGLRRALPSLFLQGGYIALETSGAKQNHVVAFARRDNGSQVIAVVPRLVAGLLAGLPGASMVTPVGPAVWEDTRVALPLQSPNSYQNVFTGETIANENNGFAIAEALKTLPVALLWAKP
jgi:(1->4)-alpha-D-glucan 1-alpha-D-glucosylmutase